MAAGSKRTSPVALPLRQPLFCWKWQPPWYESRNHTTDNKSTCGNLKDGPWLFKSLGNMGSLALNLVRTAAINALNPNLVLNSTDSTTWEGASPFSSSSSSNKMERQGEAEQRALASALACGKEATVIEFYSPKCRLCNSLLDLVLELEKRNSDWVSFVLADAENDMWLPELIHYDVKYVPCFVLLDKYGRALCKTGIPTSRLHVVAGLSHLLKLQRPRKN